MQYVDVMSLYLYICKYLKFPVGHPILHVGDVCKDIQGIPGGMCKTSGECSLC